MSVPSARASRPRGGVARGGGTPIIGRTESTEKRHDSSDGGATLSLNVEGGQPLHADVLQPLSSLRRDRRHHVTYFPEVIGTDRAAPSGSLHPWKLLAAVGGSGRHHP